GVLYGPSGRVRRWGDAIIYRGTFATGFFQCLYQPGPAHWVMLPSTLEWHVIAGLVGLFAFYWPLAWLGAAAMLGLSLAIAAISGAHACLPKAHDGFSSRLLVACLCYLQPLVRSWRRYHTRLFAYRLPTVDDAFPRTAFEKLPLTGSRSLAYWTENGG